jgi:hypothetical protein
MEPSGPFPYLYESSTVFCPNLDKATYILKHYF